MPARTLHTPSPARLPITGRTLEFVHGTGAALIGPQNLPQIIQALLEAISDGPLVAEKVCYALSQLAAGFEGGAGTSPMSPYFQTVIQALLQTVRVECGWRCPSGTRSVRGWWEGTGRAGMQDPAHG